MTDKEILSIVAHIHLEWLPAQFPVKVKRLLNVVEQKAASHPRARPSHVQTMQLCTSLMYIGLVVPIREMFGYRHILR